MIEDLRAEWGSHIMSHRMDIRRAIRERFTDRLVGDVCNLQTRPVLTEGYLSISHAPGLGGFVCNSHWVGLDIEVSERVTPELAVRVAAMEEFAAAPDPASLWCAKEALFKALQYVEQPKTVKRIHVVWLSPSQFTMHEPGEMGVKLANGTIRKTGRHTVATAIITPLD